MLKGIKKNNHNMYNRADVEHLGLPFYGYIADSKEKADWSKFASKTRLRREFKIKLTDEQLNNPDGFSRGINGYYPIWDIERLLREKKQEDKK